MVVAARGTAAAGTAPVAAPSQTGGGEEVQATAPISQTKIFTSRGRQGGASSELGHDVEIEINEIESEAREAEERHASTKKKRIPIHTSEQHTHESRAKRVVQTFMSLPPYRDVLIIVMRNGDGNTQLWVEGGL
jgi:hypothetical protein